ncbi:MAG: Uma2 family endonuclease [Ignavibacteriae bacterium]|nr:Uma2 family endonuclease [Ignavibacteriota bacterium]
MPEIAEELKLTYTDILSLGESNQRMELFDGDFVMSAMPNFIHQCIATQISFALTSYVKERKLGYVLGSPVDVLLTKHTVLQPDVSFLSHERSYINDGKKFNGAPDLVVEILSESIEERYRTCKFDEYARCGAKEYWLGSPDDEEIEVYQNSEKGFQLVKIFQKTERMNTPLFPDAEFDLHEVFLRN